MITHPFMAFYGKKYLVVGQYHRGDTLFLRCTEEPGGQISSFPASITDFPIEINQVALALGAKIHFTIQGLKDAAIILENSLETST